MTSAEATFHLGDTVVYAMHGIGRIKNIVIRTTEGRAQGFYQIVLEKNKGEVLVPVEDAAVLGLRHALLASEVPQVLQRLQQAASRPVLRGQSENHYLWCKQRLRQGQALGLAEVRRFLHDLEQVEHFTNLRLRQLRSYVYVELPIEIAQALGCSLATAEHLVDTALTSKHPVALPRP
jgi:CarD family transcriptional regulator, regulator of rRNA transcription